MAGPYPLSLFSLSLSCSFLPGSARGRERERECEQAQRRRGSEGESMDSQVAFAEAIPQTDKCKYEAPVSNRELLWLEKVDYGDFSERKYLLCNNQHTLSFQPTTGASHGLTSKAEPSLLSSVLDRARAFLPLLKEENLKLDAAVKERGPQDFDLETLAEDGSSHIQLDLALGIADLYTPEAIAKAERVVNGQVLDLNFLSSVSSSVTSSDESEYESENESPSNDEFAYDLNSIVRPKCKLQTFFPCFKDQKHQKHKRAKLNAIDTKEGS